MNNQKNTWILYLITATIIATISVQFYWNYKNYKQNKQRILNEIQISLDNSIETYYTDLSKQNFFAFVKSEDLDISGKKKKKEIWEEILSPLKKTRNKKHFKDKDSTHFKITSMSINLDNKRPLQNG